jgi:hypothetical protein
MVVSSVIIHDAVQVLPNPYSLTIKPRLQYGEFLVERILDKLHDEWEKTRDANHKFYMHDSELADQSNDFKNQVKIEANLLCAIEILRLAQKRLESISQLDSVSQIIPMVFIIRMINSKIYSSTQHISADFVELSGILGSITMDSGSLLGSTFDFKQTNLESKRILAEVNLIVESKINKQYPNLNF